MTLQDWVDRAPPELLEEIDTLISFGIHGTVEMLKDAPRDVDLHRLHDKYDLLQTVSRYESAASSVHRSAAGYR